MMKNKRKRLHFVSASIAVLMVLTIVFTTYGSVFGEVNAYASKYVSEMQVFEGDSLDLAVQACEKAGYIPVRKNINHSNSGDLKKNGIYIVGYKTTENKDEGITGISLLQMNSGYQDYTYGDIAERAVEKLGNVPSELADAVDEFAANYKKGSPAAQAAVQVLNCYFVEEPNKQKLGDYLVSGDCTVDFIKKLLSRSSTSVVAAFCNALAGGVADYGQDNWAQRVSKNGIIEAVAGGDSDQMLDVQYKVLARELVSGLQDFASGFNDAKQRYEENNKLAEVDSDVSKKTEISEETVEDMSTGGEIKSEDGDACYLAAYAIFNQYKYDDDTKLGDYLLSLGNATYDKTADLRKIYPLVDALTEGQVASFRLNGVALSAFYLANDSGILDESKAQVDAILKKIKSETGSDCISVWSGTDQTIYNQKVAVTKDAYRANTAGQIYNTLTSTDKVDDFLSEVMSMLEIATAVITICYSLTSLATTIITYWGLFGIEAASLSVWATCCAFIGTGAVGSILGVLGCAFVILNYVALVALIVVLVVMLVKYLWDLFTEDDSESFTEIPSVMFDEASNRYVRYDVVKQGSSGANINGENAKRWNALYTTKSQYVGDPICSCVVDDLIQVQYNDSTAPQGYDSVKCFGEVEAANLNANSRADAAVYMFCKGTTKAINEGEEEEGAQKYISKLSLSVEATETAAKAGLTKAGYKVLDVNLTPVVAADTSSSDKKYTYLGYTTTTNKDDAVTDIRISPRNSTDAYFYGNASYTSCGTTVTGDTLYYTSYKSAGTPILADLVIKYSLDDMPEGYEPINMFCGGNAFNFNVGDEVSNVTDSEHASQTYSHWKDTGIYLYFKPSVTYTEGEEYISGIMLVAGEPSGKFKNSAEDYMQALHVKKLSDLSLTEASVVKYYIQGDETWNKYSTSTVDTYLCYTTTHNPYRAIYGLRSYTSAPKNATVPTFLGSLSAGAYAVCDVLFELPKNLMSTSSSSEKSDYLRGIYATHSYQFALTSGASTGILTRSTTMTSVAPEDYEQVDWTSSAYRGKGIYVLGPVTGGTPLTVDDIQVSSDATIPEGYNCVQDFKTPNRTEVHNLGYNTNDAEYIENGKKLTPVYIYQKTAKAAEKKYISSISVSTYSLSKVAGSNLSSYDWSTKNAINETGAEYCVQNLLTQCTDEIIEVNLGLERSKTFQGDSSVYAPETVSYIGVSRTSSEEDAITGIIKYVTDSTTVSSTIKVGGITYTKAGDMVHDPNGAYYLYYTTSKGASPGMPVTAISVGADALKGGCATALSASSVDVSEITEGDEVIREAVTASLYGDAKATNFIYMAYEEDDATAMGAIYIGHGKTKKDALCDLLTLGCNICVDLDINRNTGGEYIYMGYSLYALSLTERRKGVPRNAVRDIVLTVGQPHQKQLLINGVKYKCAVDDYSIVKGADGTQGVSLNTGTGGKQIYLYYSLTQTKDTPQPIAKLGLACNDYGMINDDSNKWEHVFDTDGNRVNLNEGAIATVDDGTHITDNRVYMYVSRTNNAVKDGAAVDMNSINRIFVSQDIYMKGA